MNKNDREFQSDRGKIFAKSKDAQISRSETIQHLEKRWGWYVIFAFGAFAFINGWVYEAFSTVVQWSISFFHWYRDDLIELVKKPIMSLSILNIGGLLIRIAIGFFVYAIFRGLYEVASRDRSDEEI